MVGIDASRLETLMSPTGGATARGTVGVIRPTPGVGVTPSMVMFGLGTRGCWLGGGGGGVWASKSLPLGDVLWVFGPRAALAAVAENAATALPIKILVIIRLRLLTFRSPNPGEYLVGVG